MTDATGRIGADRGHELDLPPENVYGHVQRLDWIQSILPPNASIVELGCGTGYMLTYPLRQMGYRAIGVDLDPKSIAIGRDFLVQQGVDPTILREIDLKELDGTYDAVLASEVLEHVPSDQYPEIFAAIHSRLKAGGTLLVTVPNGYGWFELEIFLWFKLGIGKLLENLRIIGAVRKIKQAALGEVPKEKLPSTVAESPHVQRFTSRSIRRLLEDHGFVVKSIRGSVLFAGPFSHLFLSGIRPVMDLNKALGRIATPIASGFYVVAEPDPDRGTRPLVDL